MVEEAWSKIKYFKPKEFDSSDLPGSGGGMNVEFVGLLDELRRRAGIPLIVSEGGGYRTKAYNDSVPGSAEYSDHMKGIAVDFAIASSADKFKILKEAFKLEFIGIGIYDKHIHLDINYGSGQRVWVGKSS